MTAEPTFGLPDCAPPDAEHDPFWRSLSDGRLTLPFCRDCGRARWYLLPTCQQCGSEASALWRDLPGTGALYSWTRLPRPFVPADGPVVVGLVECDGAPGVRLVAPLAVTVPRIGMRLVLRPVRRDPHTLPVFESERSR
ncbi:Zn-ribbon domain-containing OB-fold protein [Nocardioides humi]|uniref:ChsH2 C-terminal OB-fold domain-containing protein n=1 Tax=Nocardioides humi TaxID=449461 RepID=A0ABN1ZVW4_9ACTN|nr:OB-fold domain-containing protein [Nocardioides humi]